MAAKLVSSVYGNPPTIHQKSGSFSYFVSCITGSENMIFINLTFSVISLFDGALYFCSWKFLKRTLYRALEEEIG